MAQERTDGTEQRALAARRVRAAKVACAIVAGAGVLAGAVAGLTVADALYPDRGAPPGTPRRRDPSRALGARGGERSGQARGPHAHDRHAAPPQAPAAARGARASGAPGRSRSPPPTPPRPSSPRRPPGRRRRPPARLCARPARPGRSGRRRPSTTPADGGQASGHGAGAQRPGSRQRSARCGAWRARIRKLVYLPIADAAVTRMLSTVPAGSRRSKARRRVGTASDTVARWRGQPAACAGGADAGGPRPPDREQRDPRPARHEVAADAHDGERAHVGDAPRDRRGGARRRGRRGQDRCRGCGRRARRRDRGAGARARRSCGERPGEAEDRIAQRRARGHGARRVPEVDPGAQAVAEVLEGERVRGPAGALDRCAAEAGRVAALPLVERGRRRHAGPFGDDVQLGSDDRLAGDGRTRRERGRLIGAGRRRRDHQHGEHRERRSGAAARDRGRRAHDRRRLSEGRWSREPGRR